MTILPFLNILVGLVLWYYVYGVPHAKTQPVYRTICNVVGGVNIGYGAMSLVLEAVK